MRMNRKPAFFAGACIAVAMIAACSDSATSPTAAARTIKASFVTIPAGGTPEAGAIKVCKVWDNPGDVPGGTLTTIAVTGSTDNVGPVTDTPLGITSPVNLADGACATVATSGDNGGADFASVGETVPANSNLVSTTKIENDVGNTQSAYGGEQLNVNAFHGWTVVFLNHYTPPVITGCTYTKGWYQSKNATLTGVDGLSISVENAFFQATPNKTGTVSFVGPNNLLNMYQQLLAALENGGAGGPASVQTAISNAQAGTSVSAGGQLTTTLTNAQIDALIVTLTAFNEGTFAGWPHC
jgi:hypothetical protein